MIVATAAQSHVRSHPAHGKKCALGIHVLHAVPGRLVYLFHTVMYLGGIRGRSEVNSRTLNEDIQTAPANRHIVHQLIERGDREQ